MPERVCTCGRVVGNLLAISVAEHTMAQCSGVSVCSCSRQSTRHAIRVFTPVYTACSTTVYTASHTTCYTACYVSMLRATLRPMPLAITQTQLQRTILRAMSRAMFETSLKNKAQCRCPR